MKKLKLTILLFIPILGFAQSAGVQIPTAQNDNMEVAPAAVMAKSMMADKVNSNMIDNFQDRAIQKLQDFYNYLTIISNSSYNIKMRDEAKKQAEQLFYSEGCTINGTKVSKFIDSCSHLPNLTEWKAINIVVTKGINTADSSQYNGELNYNVSVNNINSGANRATIILSKNVKQFGNRKQDLWTVFICSIE